MRKSLKSSPLKKLKNGIILAGIFLVIVVVCIYTLNSVSPTIVAFSEAKIKSLTTAAVNSAIFEVM